ncbi:MAG: RNA polymerase factor sigma-54 [Lentisphaeria bacterium]|nr:RNA polymerase factor sigma-54 [Lentisphaeria bacterium]
MENGLKQNLSLRQKQTLSQKQLQSVELLALSGLELEQRIRDELSQNPLLEEREFAREELPEPERKQEDNSDDAEDLFLNALSDNLWADDLPSAGNFTLGKGEDEGDFWTNSPAPPPSMAEQLDAEIATSGQSPRMKALATGIIDSLDERGFLSTPLADIAMQFDADMEEAESALHFVQRFDPPGIAARDLGECLRLQLERQGRLTPFLEQLTTPEALEDISQNRLPRLAAALGTEISRITQALEILKKLDPFPGSVRQELPAEPELEIVREEEGFSVVELRPREWNLFIPERYEKLLLDPATGSEDRKFIEEKLRSARELIQALRDRGSTLAGIGKVLVQTQQAFFEQGPAALKPLTMKQAGEILNRDESTISRAVSGKTVRTPQGVYPLRYFFSSGAISTDSGDLSARAVQEKLRQLVESEDPRNPLSDEKLAALLNEQGLDIARRTVAKYRDILHIPGARLRKKF